MVDDPPVSARFVAPDAPIDSVSYWTGLRRELRDYLVARRTVTVYRNTSLKMASRAGESEQAFRARCREAAEQAADTDVAKLRDKYEKRIAAVQDKLRSAERRVRELAADVEARRSKELMAGAGDLLGALLGGKSRSSGLSRAASRRQQTRRAEQRLATAQDRYGDLLADLEELEDELADDITEITRRWEEAAGHVEEVTVPLEAADVEVEPPILVWVPSEPS